MTTTTTTTTNNKFIVFKIKGSEKELITYNSTILEGLPMTELAAIAERFNLKLFDNLKITHINFIKTYINSIHNNSNSSGSNGVLEIDNCVCHLCMPQEPADSIDTTTNGSITSTHNGITVTVETPNSNTTTKKIIKFAILNLIKIQQYLVEKYQYPMLEKKEKSSNSNYKYYFNLFDIQSYLEKHKDVLDLKSTIDYKNIEVILRQERDAFHNGFKYLGTKYYSLIEFRNTTGNSIKKENTSDDEIENSEDDGSDNGEQDDDEEEEEQQNQQEKEKGKEHEEEQKVQVKDNITEEDISNNNNNKDGEHDQNMGENSTNGGENEEHNDVRFHTPGFTVNTRKKKHDHDSDSNMEDDDEKHVDSSKREKKKQRTSFIPPLAPTPLSYSNNSPTTSISSVTFEKIKDLIKSNIKEFELNTMSRFNFFAIANRSNCDHFGFRICIEYIRFIMLKIFEDIPIPDVNEDSLTTTTIIQKSVLQPSPIIERFWNTHLLDSLSYRKFYQVLGVEVHSDPNSYNDNYHIKESKYQKTLQSYQKYFNIKPDSDIWPDQLPSKSSSTTPINTGNTTSSSVNYNNHHHSHSQSNNVSNNNNVAKTAEKAKERERELEKEKERQRDIEKQLEFEKELKREIEREKEKKKQTEFDPDYEKELEKQQKLKELEKQQRELEKQQREFEKQQQKEKEKQQKEKEKQLQREKEKEKEKERQQQQKEEREREREKQRAIELEKQREKERQREEREKQRQRELEHERERERQQKEEKERQREEREKEKQREREREKEKEREREKERQRQREREEEEERKREEEREREREKEKQQDDDSKSYVLIKCQANISKVEGSAGSKIYHFKVSKKTSLTKLVKTLKDKIGTDRIKLSYNGSPITNNDSVSTLNLKDGDIIQANPID